MQYNGVIRSTIGTTIRYDAARPTQNATPTLPCLIWFPQSFALLCLHLSCQHPTPPTEQWSQQDESITCMYNIWFLPSRLTWTWTWIWHDAKYPETLNLSWLCYLFAWNNELECAHPCLTVKDALQVQELALTCLVHTNQLDRTSNVRRSKERTRQHIHHRW